MEHRKIATSNLSVQITAFKTALLQTEFSRIQREGVFDSVSFFKVPFHFFEIKKNKKTEWSIGS